MANILHKIIKSFKTVKNYRLLASEKCKINSGKLALVFLLNFMLLNAIIVFITVLCTLIGGILRITDSTSYIIVTSIIGSIIIAIYMLGTQISIPKIIKDNYNNQEVLISHIFYGFKKEYLWKSFKITLLLYIYMLLWSLLAAIPAVILILIFKIPYFIVIIYIPIIIKGLEYSFAFFVSIDYPNYGANKCISMSKSLIEGYKKRLLGLTLSYIGWFLLCIFTFGILYLWIVPKIQTAIYALYIERKTELEKFKQSIIENNHKSIIENNHKF